MRFALALALTFSITVLMAVNPPGLNATAAGLGGASASYPSLFGLHSNIAAFRAEEKVSLNFGNYFGLSEYSSGSIIGGFDINSTHIGLGYTIQPLNNLQIRQSKAGVSKQLGEQIWAGVGVAYTRFISNSAYYQDGAAVSMNLGILYKPIESLQLGVAVENPTRSKLSNTLDERLPTSIRLGVGYDLAKNITVYADAYQQTNFNLDLQAGFEYSNDTYALRAGFSVLDESLSIGAGYNPGKLSINFAANYHNRLGISPFLTLGYAFN